MKDLLQPRFIVVADYPQSIFESKQIITPDNGTTYIEYSDNGDKIEIVLADYPHLFRPLHWSEFRTLDEMPKYVRLENGEIRKVKSYACGEQIAEYYDGKEGLTTFLLPATETEYNNFINQEK